MQSGVRISYSWQLPLRLCSHSGRRLATAATAECCSSKTTSECLSQPRPTRLPGSVPSADHHRGRRLPAGRRLLRRSAAVLSVHPHPSAALPRPRHHRHTLHRAGVAPRPRADSGAASSPHREYCSSSIYISTFKRISPYIRLKGFPRTK